MSTERLRLASKVALVTGGTKGIGKAIVLAFLREGASVIFTGSSAQDGPQLEGNLRGQGHDASFVQCDSRDEQQISDLIAGIAERHGRLDIAVNNVGNIAPSDVPLGMLHESPLHAFQETIDRNLISAFLSMKHEIAVMLRQGGGVVCNTSSMSGVRVSNATSPAYHAAKAALIHLTRKAAIQYAPSKIRVNVIAPGATYTEQAMKRWSREEFDKMAKSVHPLGRAVDPAEFGEVCVFLCSDESASITGHMIPVDGGWAAT